MWKESPLDSSGFKDVDGDVEMMIAPEAYPLSSKNRKRNHDEDEVLVRVLIDSITYVSQVDVRQERNCDTNDISISGTQKFVCCQICLVELDNSDTKHRRCIDVFVWLHANAMTQKFNDLSQMTETWLHMSCNDDITLRGFLELQG